MRRPEPIELEFALLLFLLVLPLAYWSARMVLAFVGIG